MEVARRGAVLAADLVALGVAVEPDPGVVAVGGWLVAAPTWQGWAAALGPAVDEHARRGAVGGGACPPRRRGGRWARPTCGCSSRWPARPAWSRRRGRLRRPGAVRDLGPAEAAVAELERRLAADPFAAPEQADLQELGLGVREVAAAAAAGRLLRLRAPRPGRGAAARRPGAGDARAGRLPQPFTLSRRGRRSARPAGWRCRCSSTSTGAGWTRRVDGSLREVVR